MKKIIDLTGQRFGRLTVIEFHGRNQNGTYWLCRCDCGNNNCVSSGNLKNGAVISCGCARDDNARIIAKERVISIEEQLTNYTINPLTGCWEFLGYRDSDGYGQFKSNGVAMSAHRAAYEHARGVKIQDGNVVMHSCDNPPCIRPDHLSEGTFADNAHDRDSKQRARHYEGSEHGMSVLSDDQVRMIRSSPSTTSNSELANTLNVSVGTIRNVRIFNTYKNVE